jgi:hypothetical protein
MRMAASGRPLSPHALGIVAYRYRHTACTSACGSSLAKHRSQSSQTSFPHSHTSNTTQELSSRPQKSIRLSTASELGLRLPLLAPPIVICNPSLHKQSTTFRRQKTPLPPPPPPIMDSASSMTCRIPCSLTQVSCGGRLSRPGAIRAMRQALAPPAPTGTRWSLSD